MTDFDAARRTALIQDLVRIARRRPVDLLPFEAVRRELRLRHLIDRGIQEVPLDRIVGSIEAWVKEFPTPVPLDADTTIEEVLLRRGLAEFLEATGLEPEQADELRTTIPQGYERSRSGPAAGSGGRADRAARRADLCCPPSMADRAPSRADT